MLASGAKLAVFARYGFAGMFWKAVPRKTARCGYLASIEIPVEPFGDMRQELVFIGQNLDQGISGTDECLLSEEDVLRGRVYWETWPIRSQWEQA